MGPRFAVRLAVPLLAVTMAFAAQARASGPDESYVDMATLTSMEARAAAAEPREQCFLYTELLHNWTEAAGRDMAVGDNNGFSQAVQHADADAARLKSAISRNSKRLKNAELLMEHSVERFSDMLRVASMDQHDRLQGVLRHMSSVHDDLLAAVFSH